MASSSTSRRSTDSQSVLSTDRYLVTAQHKLAKRSATRKGLLVSAWRYPESAARRSLSRRLLQLVEKVLGGHARRRSRRCSHRGVLRDVRDEIRERRSPSAPRFAGKQSRHAATAALWCCSAPRASFTHLL